MKRMKLGIQTTHLATKEKKPAIGNYTEMEMINS